MATRLTPQQEATVERLISSGHYAAADQVIDQALRLLEEREGTLQWLRDELAIGEEQEKRGELVELTNERVEEIKRRAREHARNGRPIKDAVRP